MVTSLKIKSAFQIPPNPSTERGYTSKLRVDKQGKYLYYPAQKDVVIQSLSNPQDSKVYSQHKYPVTVADIAPSGNYAVSADEKGFIRVWDTVTNDNILKYEGNLLAGRICDLVWDFESQRICAVGQGKDFLGMPFRWDTGTSIGTICGHMRCINGVTIKGNRPFRMVTCGEDGAVTLFNGVPFKYSCQTIPHKGSVKEVKYSPTGQNIVSVGSDGNIIMYNPDDLSIVKKVGENDPSAHKGTIYSVNWDPANPDSRLATSSVDSTVKVWDVETSTCVRTFNFKEDVSILGQQMGNVWTNDFIISVQLDGTLNWIDEKMGEADGVVRRTTGHQKPIIDCMSYKCPKTKQESFWTSSYEGKVLKWDLSNFTATEITKPGKTQTMKKMIFSAGQVLSTNYDSTIRKVEDGSVIHTNPNSILDAKIFEDKTYVLTDESLCCTVLDGKIEPMSIQNRFKFPVLSFDIYRTNDDKVLFLLGSHKGMIYIMKSELDGDKWTLTPDTIPSIDMENSTSCSLISISPDKERLAVCDNNNRLTIIKTDGWVLEKFSYFTASSRINTVGWDNNKRYLVAGAIDNNIYLLNSTTAEMMDHKIRAHRDGVFGVQCREDNQVISVGSDGFLRLWSIEG